MQTFCAVLLGQPEEIALCALSTHFRLSAELFIIHSLFLSYTFNTWMPSIVMNVLFQIIPDNGTSKYKLILLYITVNGLKHI